MLDVGGARMCPAGYTSPMVLLWVRGTILSRLESGGELCTSALAELEVRDGAGYGESGRRGAWRSGCVQGRAYVGLLMHFSILL